MTSSRFRRFSALALGFTIAVILWGAYVRATGSGAGCGSHWPTCNGEVIPRSPSVKTIIEFTHRTTSGVAFMLVLAQLIWALRVFPRGHGVRRASAVSMFFMVTEALVGAGLVLFEMVAGNKSVARGAWMIVHLLNTFALLASMALTQWLASRASTTRAAVPAERPGGAVTAALGIGLAGVLLVAASGAIAALGDTLFPSPSLAYGLAQDVSPTAHLFVRLRVLHPVIALVVAAVLLFATGNMVVRDRPQGARRTATVIAGLVLLQLALGLANLALLAPVPLQLLHLLVADLIWIALVRLAADLYARRPAASALNIAA